MANSLKRMLVFVAVLVCAGLAWPDQAWASAAAPEPTLQSMLAQHEAQCRQYGCVEPQPWRGWVVIGCWIALAMILVGSGLIGRVGSWLERRWKRSWSVYLGLAGLLAACHVAVPVSLTLLSGKSLVTSGSVSIARYKDGAGRWVYETSRQPAFGEQVLGWFSDTYLPVFAMALAALLVAAFLLPRMKSRTLAATVALVTTLGIVGLDLTNNAKGQQLPFGPLRDRIEAMARPLGRSSDVVRVSWSLGTNVGFHNAKARSLPRERILIADSLLREAPGFRSIGNIPLNRASDRQVAALVGHELAHLELNHHTKAVLLNLFATAALTFAAAFIAIRLADRHLPGQATAPTRSAIVVSSLFASTYLAFALSAVVLLEQSRRHELAADARGLEISGDPEGFAQLLVAIQVSKPLTLPSRFDQFFMTHPPAIERIEAAKQAANAKQHTP